MLDDTTGRASLRERFHQVRDETEALAAPLSAEDQTIQSMPDASPTKWHRAHTTWFFETFLLKPHLPGYEEFHPDFATSSIPTTWLPARGIHALSAGCSAGPAWPRWRRIARTSTPG